MSDPAPSKPAKPKGARPARSYEITARVAYRELEATFRPRATAAEACQLMACFFPARLHCHAGTCPPSCPRVGGHPYPNGMPTAAPPEPTPAPGSSEDPVPRLDVAVDDVPGLEVAMDPAIEEALWAENVERWTAAQAEPPPPPAPAPCTPPAETAYSSACHRYPPCAQCGEIRPVMIAMKRGLVGDAFALCSRCYSGAL